MAAAQDAPKVRKPRAAHHKGAAPQRKAATPTTAPVCTPARDSNRYACTAWLWQDSYL